MKVLWFDASKETLRTRVIHRGETSGRVDDTAAIFEKRYQGFLDENEDIFRYFESQEKFVKVVRRSMPAERARTN